MKITLAQINTKVGDLEGNLKKIKEAYFKAVREESDLIVFPELSLTGYPPLDLLENDAFVANNIKALESFAVLTGPTACIIGYVDFNPRKKGKKLFNSAAVIENGKIKAKIRKALLPTYDIFDEARYFQPVYSNRPVTVKGVKLGVTICEDIWAGTDLLPERFLYPFNPVKKLTDAGAQLIINLSASPFYKNKKADRLRILSRLSGRIKRGIVYVNSVGANDELIFDGGSFVLDEKGKIKTSLRSFSEEIRTMDTEKEEEAGFYRETIREIKDAVTLGIKDYFSKQGFKKALLGLSGGIDSAVVAVLAAEALGPSNVIGALMPSEYTSERSNKDALKLAGNIGIETLTLPIKDIYSSFAKILSFDKGEVDLALQNLQSRIRGNLLMSLSNRHGFLVLATGNKSEIAMGYCTLYGDTAGALAPIGDVLKTDVYKIAELINEKKKIIPPSIIKRAPTAELKPGQKDRDDLPPYGKLDEIIRLYVEDNMPLKKIIKKTGDTALCLSIAERIEKNEYKRKQLSPALKISEKSFGSGRKMPIVKSPDFMK